MKMTQEDKELLIKDLGGRIPYGVKIESDGYFDGKLVSIENFNITGVNMLLINGIDISKYIVKPYLFPMSSMTEEQEKEYYDTTYSNHIPTIDSYDWLNKNHFDYRDLIDKGLAIDCTNLNIY